VAMLDELHRTAAGQFKIQRAWDLDRVKSEALPAIVSDSHSSLECWTPFDQLLDGYAVRAEASREEADELFQGRQSVLAEIIRRTDGAGSTSQNSPSPCIAIYLDRKLIAIARPNDGLERVFLPE